MANMSKIIEKNKYRNCIAKGDKMNKKKVMSELKNIKSKPVNNCEESQCPYVKSSWGLER